MIDRKGLVYGRLTVVAEATQRTTSNELRWVCVCKCGTTVVVSGTNLRTGHTTSCGCLNDELRLARAKAKKHGMKGTRTYKSWSGMIQRCTNSNLPKYYLWGGQGVTVCEQWRTFKGFFADMGICPPNKSIDRYPDSAGNYEPNNCRWATAKEQRANQRPKKSK